MADHPPRGNRKSETHGANVVSIMLDCAHFVFRLCGCALFQQRLGYPSLFIQRRKVKRGPLVLGTEEGRKAA